MITSFQFLRLELLVHSSFSHAFYTFPHLKRLDFIAKIVQVTNIDAYASKANLGIVTNQKQFSRDKYQTFNTSIPCVQLY
jgi:hypothetical protein